VDFIASVADLMELYMLGDQAAVADLETTAQFPDHLRCQSLEDLLTGVRLVLENAII
jgi:hypothetical protein